MAEVAGPPNTPQKPVQFIDAAGRAVQTSDPGILEGQQAAGGRVVSPEYAGEIHKGEGQIQKAEALGGAGQFAAGIGSGLTLGLGPGVAAQLGLIDRDLLAGLETTGAYTAGDIVGMIAPALLSGGEAVAGRGMLSTAMRLTPAALMGEAGTLAERIALRALPGEAGALGRVASPMLKMAARGATEGAIVNLGHHMGDSMIQNKPLSVESLAAAGADGALFGGLMGGGMGLVGSIGSKVADALPGVAGKGGSRAEGIVYKSLGATEDTLTEGRYSIKQAREALTKGDAEATFGSSTAVKKSAYEKAGTLYRSEAADIIKTLDREAVMDRPSLQRFTGRLDEIAGSRAGTVQEIPVAKEVAQAKELFSSLAPSEKVQPGWQHWAESRAQWAKTAQSPVGREILNALDSEIRVSMEAAAEKMGQNGLAERFAANQMMARVSEEVSSSLGSKAAKELLSSEPSVTARDFGAFAGMAAIGHPMSGAAWLAAKGIGRIMQRRMEPAVAEMAYKASMGSKAQAATANAKTTIGGSVKKFFSNATTGTRRTASAYVPQKVDRKKYEEAASRVEQLVSQNHAHRVDAFARQLEAEGYGQTALQLMKTYQRAAQYLQFNLPARKGTTGLGSLKQQPKYKDLNMNEYKFHRLSSIVREPFQLLANLENGSVSRDEAMAVKYVYPELHNEIVTAAAQQIYETKAAGKYLPVDKITQLGIVLDSAIDSILEPEFIRTVQTALNAPPVNQPQEPQQAPAQQMAMDSGLLTPFQQSLTG